MKIIIAILFCAGLFLIYENRTDILNSSSFYKTPQSNSNPITTHLKKYLLAQEKPSRVEVIGLSKRYEKEINEIKKMKLPLDPKSNVHFIIQFFSDESDPQAPLIAQIRFIETQSGNTVKEESLNLN